jgi:hypothetical protein
MPRRKPLISVLTPCFNVAAHLRQAESVWLVKTKKFAAASPQLVALFSHRQVRELVDGPLRDGSG